MADSATTSNRFRKQTLASNVNVWGDPYLNTNFDLIDAALDGVSAIAVGTATATTLTSTNYASDQTRNRVHIYSGTGTQTLTATIPLVTKNYLAINDAAGPVRYIMASGTGATVEAGRISWVVSDGTNVRLGSPRLDQVPAPTSAVSLNSQRITSLAAGTAATDAASLSNRLDQFAAPTTAVSFGTQRITNLATPTSTADAVTKPVILGGAADGHLFGRRADLQRVGGCVGRPGNASLHRDDGRHAVGCVELHGPSGHPAGTPRLLADALQSRERGRDGDG
jgi:hypothetical protein